MSELDNTTEPHASELFFASSQFDVELDSGLQPLIHSRTHSGIRGKFTHALESTTAITTMKLFVCCFTQQQTYV